MGNAMNFEPNKLFIGLIDFFSILLPGALFTFLFQDTFGPLLIGERYFEITETQGWVVFLFSSYLLGHFIVLLGSRLDDLYDAVRKATDSRQVTLLARGQELSPSWARWLAGIYFKKEEDQAVRLAVKIKERYLNPMQADAAVNAFQWSKARLTLDHPEAMAAIQQFEADSKFFRSLLVVFAILLGWGLVGKRAEMVLFSLPALVLAFSRYLGQRLKATNQAYWYIITLEGQRADGFRPKGKQENQGMNQAGGVVYRQSSRDGEVLLLRSSTDSSRWSLPAGKLRPDESPGEAAVRNVRAETGVWARISADLKVIAIPGRGEPDLAQFYVMESLEEGNVPGHQRIQWLPFEQALALATDDASRELIALAQKILHPPESASLVPNIGPVEPS